MRMRRQPVMAMLFDVMVLWSGRGQGVDVNCCIRQVPEMMEKFIPDFYCNRMSLLDGK